MNPVNYQDPYTPDYRQRSASSHPHPAPVFAQWSGTPHDSMNNAVNMPGSNPSYQSSGWEVEATSLLGLGRHSQITQAEWNSNYSAHPAHTSAQWPETPCYSMNNVVNMPGSNSSYQPSGWRMEATLSLDSAYQGQATSDYATRQPHDPYLFPSGSFPYPTVPSISSYQNLTAYPQATGTDETHESSYGSRYPDEPSRECGSQGPQQAVGVTSDAHDDAGKTLMSKCVTNDIASLLDSDTVRISNKLREMWAATDGLYFTIARDIEQSRWKQTQSLEPPVTEQERNALAKHIGLRGVPHPSRFDFFLEKSQSKPASFHCQFLVEGVQCTTKGARRDEMRGHIRDHFEYWPFKCDGTCGTPDCPRRFSFLLHLNGHQTKQCSLCHKLFKGLDLLRHVQICKASQVIR